MKDPVWFWIATFNDDSAITFYADNKPLAHDHAEALARDFRKYVARVTRLKHRKDVTAAEHALAGSLTGMRAL